MLAWIGVQLGGGIKFYSKECDVDSGKGVSRLHFVKNIESYMKRVTSQETDIEVGCPFYPCIKILLVLFDGVIGSAVFIYCW